MGSDDGTIMVHFGKHQGKTVEEIPSGYLKWMIDNLEDKEDLVEAADKELAFRDQFNTHFYD